jgi:replicative DNA helicase
MLMIVDPVAELRCALLKRYFFNREDKVAVKAPWGKPCPVETNGSADALLLGHVLGNRAPATTVTLSARGEQQTSTGRFRVGSYCPGPDGTTRWLCIDCDGEGHAFALADPLSAALKAQRMAERVGLTMYIERSGGGHGWHAWMFFEQPIPAADAQQLGHALAPRDASLTGRPGGFGDARAARGIEVFPKQATIGADGLGNMVYAPFWSGAQGANIFYVLGPDDDGSVVPVEFREFETVSAEQVRAALAELTWGASSAGANSELPLSPKGHRPPAWEEWRQQALAALPLESVYGEWLTSRRSAGWLECRDPDSPSGDRDASAGVADGTGNAKRGSFHSFITGETISVFDFLIKHGAPDFIAAAKRVADLSGVPIPAPEASKQSKSDAGPSAGGDAGSSAAPPKQDAAADKEKGERATKLAAAAPHISAILPVTLRMLKARADGIAVPIKTPWPVLTKALQGGFWPGVHYLTGSTGIGKTQFAVQIGVHAAQNKHPVLYLGLELGKEEVATRLLAAIEGISWSKLQRGDAALYKGVVESAAPKLAKLPIHIEEGDAYGWHAKLLKDRVRAVRECYPEEPDKPGSRPMLIVIDYLQIVASDPDNSREDLRQRIANAAYAARQVTRDSSLSAVVLAISSISRDNARLLREEAPGADEEEEQEEQKENKKPGRTKEPPERFGEGDPSRYVGLGKEAGELEYSAHSVIVLCGEEFVENEDTRVHIAIAKHRDGSLAWVPPLMFNGTSFQEPGPQPNGTQKDPYAPFAI